MLGRNRPGRAVPQTVRQRLAAIARPSRDAQELRPLLGNATDDDLLDEGRRAQPEQLLDDAAELYTEAWAYYSRHGSAAMDLVRGCSRELLAVAAGQALALLDRVEGDRTRAQDLTKRRTRARETLRGTFERAVKLRDQARSVMIRVCAGDAQAREAVDRATLPGDPAGGLATGLCSLAAVGRELLAGSRPPALLRMYGLDESYLIELEGVAESLRKAEKDLDKLLEQQDDPSQDLQIQVGINVRLMMQVLDAFLGAHELHSEVPLLTPKHNADLMRRISRLPPPPVPTTLKAESQPANWKGKDSPTADSRGRRIRPVNITIRKRS